jgi:DNA integrity scanning protein DisA with diadenylate cyclase activity
MNTKERIKDLASMANDLWERVRGLSNIELEDLCDEVEVEGCESDARELSCQLNDLNDDLEEDMVILTDYIPDDLSAGEYDSLKEVLNKWRTDNGYPAK